MRGGEAVQSAAGEGMTRGQYLPGGAAQQDVKGQPSALVTAPVTSAAQAACATATENPRSGEACPSRQTAAGSEGIEKMVNLTKHLNLLGMRVEDRVTGFKGVVATVGFDLYGCIQAVVNPGTDADGKLRDSQWFDVNRLRFTDSTPVMERPEFEWTPEVISSAGKGPAERPAQSKA